MSEELEYTEEQDLPEQIAIRLEKRERLNKLNDAYPVALPITHTIGQVRDAHPGLEADVSTGVPPCKRETASAFKPCSASTRLAKSSSSSSKS